MTFLKTEIAVKTGNPFLPSARTAPPLFSANRPQPFRKNVQHFGAGQPGDIFQKQPTPVSFGGVDEGDEKARFMKQLDLARQLSPELRKQMYHDLQLRHMGFWRTQLPSLAKGAAGAANFGLRSPLHVLYGLTALMNGLIPPTRHVYSTDDAGKLLETSRKNGAVRAEWVAAPFNRLADPALLEKSVLEVPVVESLDRAVQQFGSGGTVTLAQVDALVDRIEKGEGAFPGRTEYDAAKILAATFPFLSELSDEKDTVSVKTLERFNQNVRDSIPFFYEKYGHNPEKYVQTNLFYLGAAAALPELKSGYVMKNKLNENPTYRKISRWARENQLSDVQFLPWFSFIDAMYGQLVAVTTGFINEFKMSRVFDQMIGLDGFFNGINFMTAKVQILIAGWEKEKPERQRAQFEKAILSIQQDNQKFQNRLADERKKLEEKIKAHPEKKEALEKEFQETVLNPLMAEGSQLTQRLEKTQLELDKILGIKKMGFLERMWKKPPEYLNDMKYMIPLGLVLGIPYELLYFNRYANQELDLFSWKFFWFTAYGVPLSVASNLVVKQIIHLTQDRTKLYMQGQKDELLAQKTRDVLFGVKGAVDELTGSDEPGLQVLGQELKTYYEKLSFPLIGDMMEQAGTEKTLNRKAKLAYSMQATQDLDDKLAEYELVTKNPESREAKKAVKIFRKYLKMFRKIHDRLAFIPIHQTKFDLQVMMDLYEKDFQAEGKEQHIPKNMLDFLKGSYETSQAYLGDLEKKYPKAELPFEPLKLNVKENFESLDGLFKSGIEDTQALEADLGKRKESLEKVRKLRKTWFAGWRPKWSNDRDEKALLSRYQDQSDVSLEREADALKMMLNVLKPVRKGMEKNMTTLHAKSKAEAEKDLEEYRAMREDYAEETAEMSFGVEKLKRKATQAGMFFNQGFKKAAFLDKYNRWFSGYPFIPAHSLLNVAGRFGTASIILEKILPFEVLMKIWLTNHIPIRIYAFLSEKFLVLRDAQHREKEVIERKMDKGMEHYIEKLMEAQQKKAVGGAPPANGNKTDGGSAPSALTGLLSPDHVETAELLHQSSGFSPEEFPAPKKSEKKTA